MNRKEIMALNMAGITGFLVISTGLAKLRKGFLAGPQVGLRRNRDHLEMPELKRKLL